MIALGENANDVIRLMQPKRFPWRIIGEDISGWVNYLFITDN